ncbi:MAG: DUF2225 domain-containing protein [Spirochaetaceae bacterium]
MSESSVTFFSKKPIVCPVCETSFHREELRTGRGRLIAGELTHELRREYEPSEKYGRVTPILYPVTVCPNCYYAAYQQDFLEVPPEVRRRLDQDRSRRAEAVHGIFPGLDFNSPRDLEEGVASYHFAVMCYEFFPTELSPTFKQGLSCLRAAWLCRDLHRRSPQENYDYLAHVFYRKARFFYEYAVEREQTGEEALPQKFPLGPDLDKNYGYDGVLYLVGLLDYRYGSRRDPEQRRIALERAKRTVAKIFGMGKASKSKPAAILDNAREVYRLIAAELGQEERDPEKAEDAS